MEQYLEFSNIENHETSISKLNHHHISIEKIRYTFFQIFIFFSLDFFLFEIEKYFHLCTLIWNDRNDIDHFISHCRSFIHFLWMWCKRREVDLGFRKVESTRRLPTLVFDISNIWKWSPSNYFCNCHNISDINFNILLNISYQGFSKILSSLESNFTIYTFQKYQAFQRQSCYNIQRSRPYFQASSL